MGSNLCRWQSNVYKSNLYWIVGRQGGLFFPWPRRRRNRRLGYGHSRPRPADATIRFSGDPGRDYDYATTTGPDGSYRFRLERPTAITEHEKSARGHT